jgi:hypothetical protein
MRLLALLGLTALVATCASEEGLLEDAPKDRVTKVVTLEVTGNRGRLVVEESVLADLNRIPGVLKAVRGSGQNEVYCLVEDQVDPWSLARGLPSPYRVKVLGTVKKSDLPAD